MFLLLSFVAVSIAYLYTSSERFFYYWDYGGYWLVTEEQARLYRSDPHLAWKYLIESMSQDYPRFYTLAPSPLIWWLGPSRVAGIVAFTVVYQIPFALVMGGIASEVVRRRREAVFWGTALGSLLVPTAWVATLRGYPDIGGAAIFGGAVWAYLRDPRVRRPWQIVVIGACLALAPLFRRHFAYPVLTFVLVALAFLVVRSIRESRGGSGVRAFGLGALRMLAAGAVSALILGVFARPWVAYALSVDHGELYSSYRQSHAEIVWWILTAYGIAPWAVAGAGFAACVAWGRADRERTLFVAALGSATMFLWVVKVGIQSWHYALHAVELVTVGMALFVWAGLSAIRGWRGRAALCGVVATLVVGNFAFELLGLEPASLPFPRTALAASAPPLIRSDYDEVVRLVAYLREVAPRGSPVYVVDSSGYMNDDLLRKAEEMLYGRGDLRLNVLESPHVDSRDFLPFLDVTSAEVVVVSDPFRSEEGHLPTEQRVVTAGARAVLEWPTSADFERLPRSFKLAPETNYSVLRRKRPTDLATAARTLALMVDFVGAHPPRTGDWMVLRQPFPSSISPAEGEGGGDIIRTHLGYLDKAPFGPAIAYLGNPHSGEEMALARRLDLTVEFVDREHYQLASPARVEVLAYDRAGRATELADVTTEKGRRVQAFSLALSPPSDATFIVIQVSAAGPSITCASLSLDHVKLTFGPR
jgi:hypothetical protein